MKKKVAKTNDIANYAEGDGSNWKVSCAVCILPPSSLPVQPRERASWPTILSVSSTFLMMFLMDFLPRLHLFPSRRQAVEIVWTFSSSRAGSLNWLSFPRLQRTSGAKLPNKNNSPTIETTNISTGNKESSQGLDGVMEILSRVTNNKY